MRLALVTAAIGLFLAGYYWGNQYKRGSAPPAAIAGVRVRPPRALPGFELQDAAGRPFTAESFTNRWTLLSFADPRPDSGSDAPRRLIEVRNRLAGDPPLQGAAQLVVVTDRLDAAPLPEAGDAPPALRILSGAAGEKRRLRASLGAPAEEAAAEAAFYLIGPEGRLLALFPGFQSPASIASDLSAIAGEFEPAPNPDE